MRQIGERGVLAERSVTDQVADQKAINDKTDSDSLEFSEQLRVWRGGNYGTQDLMRAGHDRVARMVDTETGQLRDGVTPEHLARANQTLVASQELQGAEKQKHADEAAAMVGTMIRLGALFVPGAYPLLNLAANLSGMAIKGEIEGADYKHRQNADWVNTGTSLAADLVGMGAGKLATAGKISQGVAMGASTGAQIVAAVASSTAAGDTSEQTGGTALNVALGSFLPFLGSAAGGVIKGSSWLARAGRVVVDGGVQAGGAYGLNGGQGGLVDVIDAVGGAAGDHLGGGGPHPRRRTPTAEDHRNASGHYAEDDGPNVRHRADDSTAPTVRRVDDADKEHNTENHPVRDPARQAAAEQPAGTRHSDDEADLRKGDGDQTNATTRRRAELSARMAPDERTQREEYFREHGHTGTDLHSHFMGVTTVDDFAKEMGRKQGAPISREEMLDKMVSAVREDSDYAKHYSINEAGEQVFDHTGGGIDPKQGGHAFDNVKTIEAGKAKIDELRKQPPTPETDAEIRRIAAETIDNAMNSSQHTPYDGAYSIRDTMVKAYIDPQVKGEPTKPYANFTRMTLEALARDGVLYSEQSQSVKKLGAGNVPYDVVRDEMNRFNADRATRGEPPVDLRFLAMIETRFLGAEGSESAGTEADWKKQLDGARAMVKRGDVMGVDFASPETSDMARGGKQLEQRFEQLAIMLAEEGKEAGRKLTLRPHVGEGYIEMPNDPSTGTRAGFDRDHGDAHYGKARSNLDALIANVERLTSVRGADGKPIYDPENPAFEIRFGHATHATPEQAEAMARLGIKVEVNLGSNAISGSLQDSKTTPQGRSPDGHLHSMDDHSLLALAGAGAEVHLSTDAQSVMRTRLREEYKRAAGVLADFRGDPTQGIDPRGTMPVTRETFLAARPDVDATTARPPYQLAYGELPDGVKRNIDEAYDRMVEDSMQRQSQVDADDVHDRRRGETR